MKNNYFSDMKREGNEDIKTLNYI